MEPVTVEALTTVAGLTTVTLVVVFIVRKAANLDGQFMDRFGALLSVGVAVVLAILAGVVLGLVSGADLLQDVLNGLFAGLAASGSFDVINGAAKAANDR